MSKKVKPIVITDSGAGGLSCLKKLSDAFPTEKFIYLSDEKRIPYGNKSDEQIKSYCKNRIDFANKVGAKLLVIACNTMSVVGKRIFSASKIPVVDVVAANAEICKKHKTPMIIFCTVATSKSRAISRLSHTKGYKIVPLDGLAKDIEEHIENLTDVDFRFLDYDYGEYKTVVLGCTHYSLVASKFAKRFSTAEIIDGSEEIVKRVGELIGGREQGINLSSKPKFLGSGARRLCKAYDELFEK